MEHVNNFMVDDIVTPVTHRLHTSTLDPMQVQPHHTVTYRQTGCGRPRSGMDHQQDRMGFPIDVLFDFQHMYISRRGDTVRSPSLEINYSPCPLSPSLASSFVRLWQSEHQLHMLSPPHHPTLNSFRVSDCTIPHLVPL